MHGGLYIIDTDTEEIIHHASYEKDFINDNERGGERGLRGISILSDRIIVADSAGFIELDKKTFQIKRTYQDRDYFKSIHEIAFHDDHLWVTSTAYDAIVKVDLDFNTKGFWKLLGMNARRGKEPYSRQNSRASAKALTGKEEITAETKTEYDSYHINSISVYGNELRVAGLLTPLYDFETMKEVSSIPLNSTYRNSFVHNFYEYEDMFVANLTTFSSIGIFRKGGSFGWDVIDIPRSKNVTYQVDDIAVNNWNRGLAIQEGKIIIGSSPARLLIYDIKRKEFEKEIVLEKDIRHAIHGLEILE
tara:strand:- start:834 stop:1745 length:912 start_codon:yes stop_codon:yes gene_type:complete